MMPGVFPRGAVLGRCCAVLLLCKAERGLLAVTEHRCLLSGCSLHPRLNALHMLPGKRADEHMLPGKPTHRARAPLRAGCTPLGLPGCLDAPRPEHPTPDAPLPAAAAGSPDWEGETPPQPAAGWVDLIQARTPRPLRCLACALARALAAADGCAYLCTPAPHPLTPLHTLPPCPDRSAGRSPPPTARPSA